MSELMSTAGVDALTTNDSVSTAPEGSAFDTQAGDNTDRQKERDKSLAKLYDFGKAEGKASKRELLFKQVGDDFNAGLYEFTEPVKGRPKGGKKGALPATKVETDMDVVFGRYADGVRSQAKGKSPGVQISKLVAMARWGAGKEVWEYPAVLKEGMELRARLDAENADAAKSKPKGQTTPIEAMSIAIYNMAVLQTDGKNGHADRRLTEDEIKQCVHKKPADVKPYVEKLDNFIDVTVEEVTDDNPHKELFEAAATAMRALHTALAENYEVDQQALADQKVLHDLINRGIVKANKNGTLSLAN